MMILVIGFSSKPSSASDKPWLNDENHTQQDIFISNGILSENELRDFTQRGFGLFTKKFTTRDGVGRPMATQAIIPTKRKQPAVNMFSRITGLDANSCASCHNEPIIGGAGNFSTNVFVSEGFTSQGSDSTDPQFSNERNTNHLMGVGLVELLAREMTLELHTIRSKAIRDAKKYSRAEPAVLITKGVRFGTLTAYPDGLVDISRIVGIDDDLVIRPFSQKGVITSIRQFTINALNSHSGIQATERFGVRWTGNSDFDEDGAASEFSPNEISALVAWQATLPPPTRLNVSNIRWRAAASQGEIKFNSIGCSSCHQKYLPLDSLMFSDPGQMDVAGTIRPGENGSELVYNLELLEWAKKLPKNELGQTLVPLFGDLKRYNMVDAEVSIFGNELISQRFVERGVFMTAELWGIASTAPYGHRGDITTLDEVIKAHGGESRNSRDNYVALSNGERDSIIAFLKTLVIEE